jgi:hypothetical protein
MTKHEEIIKKARIYHTCDFCNARMSRYKGCLGCGRDICDKCSIFWYYDPFSGNDNGDYPPPVCNECDNKVKQFALKAADIREKVDMEIDAIEQEWRKACHD